jgi:parvulin-like peptidyl-prolyl isomerase
VAFVNAEVLTQGDLTRLVDEHIRALRIYERRAPEDARAEAEGRMGELLDTLIASTLLEQQARKQEREDSAIQITQVMLDDKIDQFRRLNGLRADEDFNLALSEQGYTQATFRREMLRNSRIEELFRREIVPRLSVTDDEVVAYLAANADTIADKTDARNMLRESRFGEERQKYIDALRDRSYVKILAEF